MKGKGTGVRGRPRIVHTETLNDESARNSANSNESGNDSDDSIAYLSANRQKRLRTIDIAKEVLVLGPKDDVEEVLGLTPAEAEEFADFLETSDGKYFLIYIYSYLLPGYEYTNFNVHIYLSLIDIQMCTYMREKKLQPMIQSLLQQSQVQYSLLRW